MASINDVGVPGQPLNTPPLTEWQKAVQLVLDGSDVPIGVRNPGGVANLVASVPSSLTESALTYTTSPWAAIVWGGVTQVGNGLTVAKSGLYRIAVHGNFGTTAGGSVRSVFVLGAGQSAPGGQSRIGFSGPPIAAASIAGTGLLFAASGVWQVGAGNSITAVAKQDSGAALQCNATLSVHLIHET